MKTFFPFTIEHDSLVLLYKTNLIYVAQSKILNLWKINNLICSSTVWWWKWNGLNQSNHCFVATNLLFQYVLTENERYDLWNLHFEFVFEWYFVTGEGLEKDNERMKLIVFISVCHQFSLSIPKNDILKQFEFSSLVYLYSFSYNVIIILFANWN